jgi:hypothetical protein
MEQKESPTRAENPVELISTPSSPDRKKKNKTQRNLKSFPNLFI